MECILPRVSSGAKPRLPGDLVQGPFSSGPDPEHFGRTHRVVAVDLRGHGASDKPVQDYTIVGFADDLTWPRERLDLVKPVVVGHSMGRISPSNWVLRVLAALERSAARVQPSQRVDQPIECLRRLS
jgi:pimeloyl-ACP methyl ester carboxylesterase